MYSLSLYSSLFMNSNKKQKSDAFKYAQKSVLKWYQRLLKYSLHSSQLFMRYHQIVAFCWYLVMSVMILVLLCVYMLFQQLNDTEGNCNLLSNAFPYHAR